MLITVLGTATSQGIPVIGCKCAACKSSDPHDRRLRCSALISHGDTNVVIDVGPDFREQMLRAEVNHLDAVVITHEHNDHIIGLDDLRPFIFMQRTPMPIYAEPRVIESIRQKFDYAFREQPYPGAPSFQLIPIKPGEKITINDLELMPLRVQHGRLPILGFRVGKLGYFTDANIFPDETLAALEGIDYLLIDALRKQPHHSHNTIEQAIAYIDKIRPSKSAHLIHMSHLLGPVSEWSKELPPDVHAAYDGLQFEL